MRVVARWTGPQNLQIEIDGAVVWEGFGPYLERVVQILGVLNAEGVLDEFDETEDEKQEDEKEGVWVVYSREECLFNYCPNPETCKQQNECQHPY